MAIIYREEANLFVQEIRKLIHLLSDIENDINLQHRVHEIAQCCVAALKQGNKILFAGNGGSAADSQHLAAELVGRLGYHRPGLAAVALTTDTSALTAIGNDYSFESIFSRQIEAIGMPGDIFVGISTSGKSPNILKAMLVARERGLTVIGFTGKNASLMEKWTNCVLCVPSTETSKIQECHIMLGHIICGMVENELFGAEYDPERQAAAKLA